MSVRFQNQYFSFKRVMENHTDNTHSNRSYAKVVLSSSWKDGEGKRHYSDWIARFKNVSLIGLDGLKHGDFISCTGSFTHEGKSDETTGKKTYFDPQMTVFEWKMYDGSTKNAEPSPTEEEPEFPF